jgi:DNA-directed RNA polymerase subunit RPC12/RpoP
LFCSKCGNKLKEDAHFCSDCGAPVGLLKRSARKKTTKELDYVECPNCKAKFDNRLEFDLTKNWVGLAKFRCTSCNRIFNYPVSKSYVLQIFIGLSSFLASFPVSETSVYENPERAAFGAILWLMGIGFLIQGLAGSIKNNRLKTEYPDWGNRFHNTLHSTFIEPNNSTGK